MEENIAVKDFMAVVECKDLQKAKQYMQMANYQIDVFNYLSQLFILQTAVQLYLDNESNQEKQQQSIQIDPRDTEEYCYFYFQQSLLDIPNKMFEGFLLQQLQMVSTAEVIRRYRLHQQHQATTPQEGIASKLQGRFKSICKIMFKFIFIKSLIKKIQDNYSFNGFPNKKLKFHSILTLETLKRYLTQNSDLAFSAKKPLCIYLHSDSAMYYINHLFSNVKLVESLNKNYRILGLLQSEVNQFDFCAQKLKVPCFLLFRKNIFDKIVLMGCLNLTQNTSADILIEQIKDISKQYFIQQSAETEDNHFEIPTEILIKFNVPMGQKSQQNQIIQQQNQIPQIQSQIQQKQQVKWYPQQFQQQQQVEQEDSKNQEVIQEEKVENFQADRHQDNQKFQNNNNLSQVDFDINQLDPFQNNNKTIIDEQKEALKIAEAIEIERQQQLKLQKHKMLLEEEQKKKKFELLQIKKKQLLQQLEEEPNENEELENIISFQFRLQNGQNIKRRFLKSQRIQILFDYALTQEEENIEFDLIQNFPPLQLMEQKEQTIEEVFQNSNSEQLIVKEIE